jgi:predicted transglutaminase-like cysteine proteinase
MKLWKDTIQPILCNNIIEEKNQQAKIYLSKEEDYLDTIKECESELEEYLKLSQDLQFRLSNQEKENNSLKQIIAQLQVKIEELMLKAKSKEEELEEYWNNKITPNTYIGYRARDGKVMNVLDFWNKNNNVPTVSGKDNDTKAMNALRYVINNVVYTSDMITSGRREQWQWADETLKTKKGDCEDGAILMANIMLKSGISYWRIRLNAGDVKGGGHAYVTYLREKDNKWYVLDWCYWPNESLNFGQLWAVAKNYFGIWFSWNNKYGFQKDVLDR